MPEEIVEQIAQYTFSLAPPAPDVTFRADAAGAGTASADEDSTRFDLDLKDDREQMRPQIPRDGVPGYGVHMNPSTSTNASFEASHDSDSRGNHSREGKKWKWVYWKEKGGKGGSG